MGSYCCHLTDVLLLLLQARMLDVFWGQYVAAFFWLA
jgi:hypothetical protein